MAIYFALPIKYIQVHPFARVETISVVYVVQIQLATLAERKITYRYVANVPLSHSLCMYTNTKRKAISGLTVSTSSYGVSCAPPLVLKLFEKSRDIHFEFYGI